MTIDSTPIVFGTSCLGNLYREIPLETKTAIAGEWFKAYPKPVIDSAGKYGAGLSLECIGKTLKLLGKKPGDITISVKLGWRRKPLMTSEPTFEPGAWAGLEWDAQQDISYDGILRCYEEAKELLNGYAKAPVEYQTKLFVQKELDIRGSRNATPANFRRVIEFARRGLFPIAKMLTKTYDFADAGRALADWDAAPGKVCRLAVKL